MAPPIQRNEIHLEQVGATIISLMKSLGVYRYNKLLYLFEYLHIKNFGKRYTKEVFIKYTHGPVIRNYKAHLVQLEQKGIAQIDISLLMKTRKVDNDPVGVIPISATDSTIEFMVQNPLIRAFVNSLCDHFGEMDVEELERYVYATEPIRNYLASPFKKPTGGYILSSDCIKLAEHKSALSEGRRMASEHLEKYPKIDYTQHRKLAEEFSDLSAMRPA
jgi:uncharacterized phage-associated protein